MAWLGGFYTRQYAPPPSPTLQDALPRPTPTSSPHRLSPHLPPGRMACIGLVGWAGWERLLRRLAPKDQGGCRAGDWNISNLLDLANVPEADPRIRNQAPPTSPFQTKTTSPTRSPQGSASGLCLYSGTAGSTAGPVGNHLPGLLPLPPHFLGSRWLQTSDLIVSTSRSVCAAP